MGRPKSDVDSSYISFRYSDNSKNELDKFSEERNTTRTETIVKAISHYIHSKQCVLCGAVNPGEGKHCAVCGADLFSHDEVTKAAITISEAEFENYISGDYQLLEKLPSLEKAGFEKEYTLTYAVFDEEAQQLYGFNRVMPTLELRLKLKNTDSVISGEDGYALGFSIDSKLLYAMLVGDSDLIAEISKKITNSKIENPSLSKRITKRIPRNM